MRGRLRFARATMLAAAVLLACAGCATWKPSAASDPRIAGEYAPGPWRVTLRDGRRMELAEIVVHADTLSGFPAGTGPRYDVLMSQVAMLERRGTSASKTVLLTLGLLALAGIVVFLATFEYPT